MEPGKHLGWHSRGYLPHADFREAIQSLTFRLFDSVPREVLLLWRQELELQERLSNDEKAREFRKRLAKFEDQGLGACYLRIPSIGQMVEEALLHFDGTRYRLLAWCIMPNHVHALCEQCEGFPLSRVVHSWKSFTSKEANRMLGRTGEFWMVDYHDRHIRDAQHLRAAINYIELNPVVAKLVQNAENWDLSSARRRASELDE